MCFLSDKATTTWKTFSFALIRASHHLLRFLPPHCHGYHLYYPLQDSRRANGISSGLDSDLDNREGLLAREIVVGRRQFIVGRFHHTYSQPDAKNRSWDVLWTIAIVGILTLWCKGGLERTQWLNYTHWFSFIFLFEFLSWNGKLQLKFLGNDII